MTNVFELSASLGLDSSGFDKGLKDAEKGTDDLSAKTVAFGTMMADAFEAVIAKVGEFAGEVIEAGAQEEQALAKVNTIMDSSVVSTEDMGQAIKDLSNEMGISVASLSDSVYNAISATGDTAGAVDLVAQASKLATGGFTETESALSVLTTAMNAYGESAGTVEHISNSLMVVQNRGVTTVGELASSMGKAIAGASAYGVNLENLESAYISITKAGISTAEGTTYISSMLKELGDTGSDVSGILKDKTGKSFGELLGEGKSLGDVLDILYKSVNGDSTALMNLWSSAEAGKASSAIVGQGIDYFNESLKELQTNTTATESAYAEMSDTFAHKQDIMATKMENMKAELFTKIEPMLSKFFDWMETTGIPLLEDIINNLDTIVPIILGIATALGVLAIALNITAIIDGVSKAFAVMNAVMLANPIGIIIALIAGLVVALVGLWNNNEEFRTAVIEMWTEFKEVVGNAIESAIEWIDKAVKAVFEFSIKVGTKIAELVKTIFNLKVQLFKAGIQIVEGLWEGIKDAWKTLIENVVGLVSDLVGGIKDILGIHSPSKVFEAIGRYNVEGFMKGMDTLDVNKATAGFNEVVSSIESPAEFGMSVRGSLTAPQPIINDVHVTLEGDAERLFKVMQKESQRNYTLTGMPSFA